MSALPPKADMRPGAQNVRKVPKADIGFDLARLDGVLSWSHAKAATSMEAHQPDSLSQHGPVFAIATNIDSRLVHFANINPHMRAGRLLRPKRACGAAIIACSTGFRDLIRSLGTRPCASRSWG